jgi:RNase P protein component
MRESARHIYPQLASGWDLMLVARAAIVKAKEPQVRDALTSLLERAGLSRFETGES